MNQPQDADYKAAEGAGQVAVGKTNASLGKVRASYLDEETTNYLLRLHTALQGDLKKRSDAFAIP
jgi:hypothetical protein